MNKNKISPTLLEEVNVLNVKNVFLLSHNFDKTKKFLLANHFKFTPYRFANCFSLNLDKSDIEYLSDFEDISFITCNSQVLSCRLETDYLHLSNLTENKYLGQNETICFIDTGISPHFDFILPKNRIIKFIDLINHKTYPYDDNGHGTVVTGIACGSAKLGEFVGFAPRANIIAIKALSDNGSSDSNVILDAMQWVYENHKVYNISVVCMSFGADSINPDPLSQGANALWERGITVVAAAGNSGPKESSIKSPGNNPNIITVGGLDITNLTVADFSSRGPTIYGHKPDLLAPAVNIISTNNGNEPYTTMSGTSVATPIVAGICADIKSRFPKMTNVEIKNFLLNNCTKITNNTDIEGAGYLDFKNLKFD